MNVFHVILVGAGGCLGSIARYLTIVSIDKRLQPIFPYGTLTVNILGSFILGFVLAWVNKKSGTHSDQWRLLLGTGFCGGFTTFSSFAAENLILFQHKLSGTALVYTLISIGAGLLAVWLGFAIHRMVA
jgi:fluoride exporter